MRRLFTVVIMLGLGAVLAHAELLESEPAAGTVLDTAPQQVVLQFSEPVEVLFSVFKVYRLETDIDLTADNAVQRLNGLAGALVNEVLELREDTEARVDFGAMMAAATAARVPLELVPDLPDGHYVAMWRVLSIDTHVTQGFFVFSLAAEAEARAE